MTLRIILLSLAFWLFGCTITGESPPSQFYILPSPREIQPLSQQAEIIALAPVRLPKYLERPQIVTLHEDGKIGLAEFHRWAEPLRAGFTRVLSAGLAARLPQSHIITLPASRAHPDWVLQTQVHEFQVYPDHCRLQVDWRLNRGDQVHAWHREDIHQPLAGRDYTAIVTAMGLAVDRLAARVAETLARPR